MDPVIPKVARRDSGGSNVKAEQLLDRWPWAFYPQPVPSRMGVNSVCDFRNLKIGSSAQEGDFCGCRDQCPEQKYSEDF